MTPKLGGYARAMGIALVILIVLIALAFGLGAVLEAAWWLFTVLVIGAVVLGALAIGMVRRGSDSRRS